MKIPPLPFTVTDWADVAPIVHPGESGQAIWRTFNVGDLRVRQVEYTAGYRADHWCDLGHVLYVLEGELDTELRDGAKIQAIAGNELSGLQRWRRAASLVDPNERKTLYRRLARRGRSAGSGTSNE